ncbi:hypothetical protein EC396_07435 [Lutibacter sp. HS1-25]|nr:hypothetical protein EC396_07435 [Lutibacter sp. HS1-25]
MVVIAFYLMYTKLVSNQLLSFQQLNERLSKLFSAKIWVIISVLLLTDINWFLEIFKWKTLVSVEKKITFLEAYQQSLASLTVSLITPNRIGEYGAKALFFEAGRRKKIMTLNLVGNLIQLAITCLFGLYGFLFFMKNFKAEIPKIDLLKVGLIFLIFALIYFFRKQLNLNKISVYLKNISKKIYLKAALYSFLRYLVFSHQFYFLLKIMGIETDYPTLISLIFCMYFMASVIPSLAIFDWVIKGSIAIWLFGFVGLNQLTVVTVTTVMWILNFAIPSIIGSIFVLNFKTNNSL